MTPDPIPIRIVPFNPTGTEYESSPYKNCNIYNYTENVQDPNIPKEQLALILKTNTPIADGFPDQYPIYQLHHQNKNYPIIKITQFSTALTDVPIIITKKTPTPQHKP